MTSTNFVDNQTVIVASWANDVNRKTYVDNVSVKDFGAKGDGVTDDTIAIQAAINAVLVRGGKLTFPTGNYVVSSTLQVFTLSSAVGIRITGEGGGYLGSTILWKGNNPTGYVMHLRGCNFSIIENLNFSLFGSISTYPYRGAIFVETAQQVGGGGSSGVCLRDLHVFGGIGTGSFAVRLGNNNFQVSEIECQRVHTSASFNGVSYVTEYGFIINTANTKDMTFIDCSQIFYTIAGVYYEAGISGWHIWQNLGGGSSACDFRINGSGNLKIIGGGSEGSAKFISQVGGGANFGAIQVFGYQLETCVGPEMISLGSSSLELQGCSFLPLSGTSPLYITVPDGGLSSVSANALNTIVSTNNYYQFAADIIPIHSYSLPIEAGYVGPTIAPIRVYSQGDTGGTGNAQIKLKPVFGQYPVRFQTRSYVSADWAITRALPFKTYTPSIPVTVNKYTIDYTFLKDNANALNIGFMDVFSGGKIIGCYANITNAFALGASNITMSVGNAAGTSQELLVTAAVSGRTGVLGMANADLGSWLASATIVQGGYVNLTATTNLAVRFTSSVGNFGNGTVTNLTSGSVDIYILTQDLF